MDRQVPGTIVKIFAVILTSIAALAASVQAYLVWDLVGGASEAVNKSYRSSACQGVLEASATLRRIEAKSDAFLTNAANEYKSSLSSDEGDIEAQAQDYARQQYFSFFGLTNFQAEQFVDVHHLYFSETELARLHFPAFQKMIEMFPASFVSAEYFPIMKNADEFNEFRSLTAEIGAKYDEIKEFCAPIILS